VNCVVYVIRDAIVSIVYVVYRIILLTMPMSMCVWLVKIIFLLSHELLRWVKLAETLPFCRYTAIL